MEITVTSLNKCTNDTSDQQLFHSILPRKGSTNHLLTYPKEHTATAVAMITGLIPFVLQHYGDKTRKWFSLRALDGSSHSRWDQQTGAVITPKDKVIQDGLSSKYWWLAKALQGVEAQEPTEPARHINRNAKATGRRLNTGSQVTFSKNMETTYQYDSKNKDNHSSSSSSQSSAKSVDSSSSESDKGQDTGHSTSEDSGSDSNKSGSDSNTKAVKKLLMKNPNILKDLLAKAAKRSKPKTKPKHKKEPAKTNPPRTKKARAPLRGSSSKT
jgi:hypothetical protein